MPLDIRQFRRQTEFHLRHLTEFRLRTYGIRELVRTGVVAMVRGHASGSVRLIKDLHVKGEAARAVDAR